MKKGAMLLMTVLMLAACAPSRSFAAKISVVKGEKGPGFSPATTFVLGSHGSLKVTNTLDKPHGFSIDELNVKKIIEPGGTIEVKLAGVQPVDYQYYCQLHDVVTGKGKHQRGLLRVAR
ncbi:MAG: cupredoxin domain-containing protein [Actinomycetota bacterium]|nr:cupredoxin domain-containing protein [Actinomycetota bacterium]